MYCQSDERGGIMAKLKPELSVLYCKIMAMIAHVPPEPKAQIGNVLKQAMLNVSNAIDYVPPPPTTGG